MKNLTYKEMVSRFAEIGGFAFGDLVRKQIQNINAVDDDDEDFNDSESVYYSNVGIMKSEDDDFEFNGYITFTYMPEFIELTGPIEFDAAALTACLFLLKEKIQEKINSTKETFGKIIKFPGKYVKTDK